MKKKIAICANGWNYDSLQRALKGITEYAKKEDFDTFVFMNFASYSEHVTIMQGELNVFNLIEPENYDGIIVFSTHLNSPKTAEELCRRANEKRVPVVSVGVEMEGIDSICVRNEDGMRELVEHLLEKHDIKKAFFIGGTKDHIDSLARLNTTRQVLGEHGITLTDDEVGYGRWGNRHTSELVDKVIDSGNIPDVFICANDIMAMAAATELEKRGYPAPDKILVTGYDNCSEGKMFYPALSSVEQNYEAIGYRACELIFERICGRIKTERETIPSRFVCGESCGCKGEEDYFSKRILYCRHSYQRNSDARQLEQNERVMRQWLSDMPNYKVMKETLQDHYKNNHQFEGRGFYIVINSEYFRDVMSSEKELWERGKESEAEVVVALKDGELRTDLSVDWKTIIPGYSKESGKQDVFFILPMHYFEYNYGYVVITDFPYIMSEDMLYPYMEKLQQSLKLMRINLRLKMLYDKDQMTGLFNRFGYEEKALPLYEESVRNQTGTMVMFVDINYMKRINDEFGHLHGDNAIKTVVAAIDDNLGEHGIGVRFGGDEFLVIEPDCDEEKAAGIKRSILGFLEKRNKEKTVPYDISVSVGFVVTDPKNRPTATLQDYIREADKLMYEIKKEMHKENDRRQGPR